jgi:hypothetical protein
VPLGGRTGVRGCSWESRRWGRALGGIFAPAVGDIYVCVCVVLLLLLMVDAEESVPDSRASLMSSVKGKTSMLSRERMICGRACGSIAWMDSGGVEKEGDVCVCVRVC